MNENNTKITYLTLKQFADKYSFTTVQGLRVLIRAHKDFKYACVRRIGKKILLNEESVLNFIENTAEK